LELNKRVEPIAQIALGDDQFLSLVYPAAVREILTRVLFVEDRTDLNGPVGDWQTQWLRFACALPGIMPPPRRERDSDSGIEDRQFEWVEEAVDAFCAHQKVLERFSRVHSAEVTP
jgi:hypothetical protein